MAASSLIEDAYIATRTTTYDLSELEDCAIAVDASYYLHKLAAIEDLRAATGGFTRIEASIEVDLDNWDAANTVPFFVFDGQHVVGQAEVARTRGIQANMYASQAWSMYHGGKAEQAVQVFGKNDGAFNIQTLYPMLQRILKKRKLHFLVAPHNAAAQIAYLDYSDSEQIGGIMGSDELLLYPIHDCLIKNIDWHNKQVKAVSRNALIAELGGNEWTFIDALLMVGSSFLVPFPPLQDPGSYNQPHTIRDALNMLRTNGKSVAAVCTAYDDVLRNTVPDWLDRYRKARMAVKHHIYIAESGEVSVAASKELTGDNHEYLGLSLPEELLHYLNTRLIGPRILNWITFLQVNISPTLDGIAAEEYKTLVTSRLVPLKEMTLGLVIPRLHRGIGFKDVVMRVWFDPTYSLTLNHRNISASLKHKDDTWAVTDELVTKFFPDVKSSSLTAQVGALKNAELVKETLARQTGQGASTTNGAKGSKPNVIESGNTITTVTTWKFLHLRDYVDDSHQLTTWGRALNAALDSFAPAIKAYPEAAYVQEVLVVALDLVKFDVLNTKHRHEELLGLSAGSGDEDRDNNLLLSRCAVLLKLRHATDQGLRTALNRNLLAFRTLVATVQEADRDLIEAIVASMFLGGRVKRERDDLWDISERLPFLRDPDIHMAIAVKHLLEDSVPGEPKKARLARIASPWKWAAYATHVKEDMNIFYHFFMALYAGVRVAEKELSARALTPWDNAKTYLEKRWSPIDSGGVDQQPGSAKTAS